ncbi:MAG: diadenylate cyclase CdaA [Bdellovibrionaceae bacterium]|nr:diadenylate cyclase CdaA [Pseudobdellovibrionaceae bacterium]MBX3035113.1 diadenylate cyclase CdaA [Pseudobdellovibrionaceae bacterium]
MWSSFLEQLEFVVGQIRPQDLIDIALVWLIVYKVLILIRRTGTVQMLSGLGVLAIGYILSIWLELFTFNWLLEKFFANLFVIVVILFQGEIRRALAHIGSNPFFTDVSAVQETEIVEDLAKGILQCAFKGFGALIVIEREIMVDYHIEPGTEMDAKVSTELITSIFHPSSPMHDGAVLVRGGRIHSAGCFLPLSKNPVLDKNLGTRHRAAVGLTEETDAIVFVISEESQLISIVQGGRLRSNAELGQIRRTLYQAYGLAYQEPQDGERL